MKVKSSAPVRHGATSVKVKGCYECSRRRISCDRQSPACLKCRTRGLECSGLGIRYRFNNGLATRGKLVGKRYPLEQQINDVEKLCHESQHATWQKDDSEELGLQRIDSLLCAKYRNVLLKGDGQSPTPDDNDTVEEGTQIGFPYYRKIGRLLDHLDRTTRSLMSYFSTSIAPILAVIDRGFNGYRDLILPFADSNVLVRKTIVMISTEHISTRGGDCLLHTAQLYHDILQGLHKRSLTHSPHQDHVAMTTFLLLLVREMITGGDRFTSTYAALRHLIRQGGTDLISGSAMGRFVAIQILRVQLCAESVYSELEGQQLIQLQLEHCLEFLRLCQSLHPEHARLMTLLFQLISQACTIYLQRVTFDPDYQSTQDLVEQFKQTAELVNEYNDVVGWQLLHWPYFIAAAESSTCEHREYFVEKLKLMHQRTGCQNTTKAVGQLEALWAFQPTIRWTSLLGGQEQIFIM